MKEPEIMSNCRAVKTTPRGRHASLLSADERFWSRVEKTDTCWIWRGAGSSDPNGYGVFQAETGNRRLVRAHRWAYQHLVGSIPDGLQLDHLCRNRHCVNPAHLEPVTCKENLLRGETLNAVNAAKTHCPAGHDYATYAVRRRGRRICTICQRDAQCRHRSGRKVA